MSHIRTDSQALPDYLQPKQDAAERSLQELIESVKKDRSKAVDLARFELKHMSPAARSHLSTMLAQQLRGQIPPGLAQSLNEGTADPALLSQLVTRLANSAQHRLGVAQTPELARALATDGTTPQQALQWAQFVQKTTHIPGAGVQGRAGSASPKGEGTILAELIGSKIAHGQGPGLRNPKLVERAVKDLSPTQRAMLMKATFGEKLAMQLQSLGITDPLTFVKAGAMPGDRSDLAANLNIPRGRLLGLLMRAELLKIGPGRNGELGMRPDFLGPLKAAGIAMLGTMAAVRSLSREELAHIYTLLRKEAGGFKTAIKGGRVPVKRDLVHWARTAARRRSEILLADGEEYATHRGLSRSDGQELIQAWYLENLLWTELANAKRREQERIMRDQHDNQRHQSQQEEDDQADEQWAQEELSPELEYDGDRNDNLMCFWVTDYNMHPLGLGGLRRMYVCIDPDTGAIIPQAIEQEYLPAF